ncbi:MAG: ribonuclease E/G [Pseudobutyrivibrio sp.]|nr:ribonuclease E/G [Pseudobutyrivibrio sp.]
MGIKKIILTKGQYQKNDMRVLVSFDDSDKALDIINLDRTHVGEVYEATVEKVLKDIDSSILNLSNGEKGFIENRKLFPENFLFRHSESKLVCQGDKFLVEISQDRKGSKPFSCHFVKEAPKEDYDFIDYFVSRYMDDDYEIISDLSEVIEKDLNVRAYTDDSVSLWQLYDITKLLDRATSKVIHLKNGGNIVIEPTEALTVIDVNTSKSNGKAKPMDTNLLAVEAIASQLRLRSISGIIIIDFLKVSKGEEQLLISSFKEQCKCDISKVAVHEFTHLGLLEITRSRLFSGII